MRTTKPYEFSRKEILTVYNDWLKSVISGVEFEFYKGSYALMQQGKSRRKLSLFDKNIHTLAQMTCNLCGLDFNEMCMQVGAGFKRVLEEKSVSFEKLRDHLGFDITATKGLVVYELKLIIPTSVTLVQNKDLILRYEKSPYTSIFFKVNSQNRVTAWRVVQLFTAIGPDNAPYHHMTVYDSKNN